MTDQERREWDLKLRKLDAEIGNLFAQTAKLNAETTEIARERFRIPFTVFAGVVVAAISAAATLTLRLLG